MEILAGLMTGITVFLLVYREHLRKEEKIKELIRILRDSKKILFEMDEKTENRIWSKIDNLETRVNELEVTLKVSLANLKGKVARNAAVVTSITTALTVIGLALVKEYILK